MVTNTIPAVIKIIVRQGGMFVFKGTGLQFEQYFVATKLWIFCLRYLQNAVMTVCFYIGTGNFFDIKKTVFTSTCDSKSNNLDVRGLHY